MPQNVLLPGPPPWGFRLSGGIDFNQPLIITRITPGSKASQANLCPGDIIIAIDGHSTENMTHNDAQEKIKAAALQLCLKIERMPQRAQENSEDGWMGRWVAAATGFLVVVFLGRLLLSPTGCRPDAQLQHQAADQGAGLEPQVQPEAKVAEAEEQVAAN